MLKLFITILIITAQFGLSAMNQKTWYVERDKPKAPVEFSSFNAIVQALKNNQDQQEAQKRLLVMQLINKRIHTCFVKILKSQSHKHDPQDKLVPNDDIEHFVISIEINDQDIKADILSSKPFIAKFIERAITCDFFEQTIYFKVLWPKFAAWKKMYINENTLKDLNVYLDSVEKAALLLLSDQTCEAKQKQFSAIKFDLPTADDVAVIRNIFTFAFDESLKICQEKQKEREETLRKIAEQKKQEEEKRKQLEAERIANEQAAAQKLARTREEELNNVITDAQLFSIQLRHLDDAREIKPVQNKPELQRTDSLGVLRAVGPKGRRKPTKANKFSTLEQLREKEESRKKESAKSESEQIKEKEKKAASVSSEQPAKSEPVKEAVTTLPDITTQLRAFARKNYSDHEQFAHAIVNLERWHAHKILSTELEKEYQARIAQIRSLFAEHNYKNVTLDKLIEQVRKEKEADDTEVSLRKSKK